jgi:hypothetical protein
MSGGILGCVCTVAMFMTGAAATALSGQVISRAQSPVATSVDTVFIVPGSHLDIGYTDTPGRVREARIEHIENAIRAAKSDPDFHWFEEGGWSFDAWLQRYGRDDKRLTAMRDLMKGGQIGVGATWLSPHAAAFPDALEFLTVHLDELDRRFGYRPSVAVLNDPPSYPEALADALAAHGVRYLLVGANMFISGPFPAEMVRTPFWWETASGNRLLVYIDPDGFTAAFDKWGLGPRCAQALNPERFPRKRGDMGTIRAGIRAGLGGIPATYHATIVQQSLDNWDTECATELPGAVRKWNHRGERPQLVIAQPEAYFRDIEKRYGRELPVRRGEWGGQWDEARATTPVWTWRLREAARKLAADAPRDSRAALATTLDHNLAIGPGRDGMTERECRTGIQEAADFYRRAVRLASGPQALTTEPPDPPLAASLLSAVWTQVIPSGFGVRLRSGPHFIVPFVRADAPVLALAITTGERSGHLAVRTVIDRRTLAEGHLVIEVPLRGSRGDFRLAPARSPDAIAGRWLAGEPGFVIAPDSLRVIGSSFSLHVTSATVFAWTLLRDEHDTAVTWLQGLVSIQAPGCILEGRRRTPLTFEVLHPGEPARLVVQLDISVDSVLAGGISR